MNLDLAAAVLCGFMTLCLFALHIVSSPGRKAWISLPEYLRRGILLTGVVFFIWSLNFTRLQPASLGHINADGVVALVCLAYLFGAFTWFVASNHLPQFSWDRLAWIKREEQRDPTKVPVMHTPAEVAAMATKSGIPAVPPGADVNAVIDAISKTSPPALH